MKALLKLVAQDLSRVLRDGLILSGVVGCPGLVFEYRARTLSATQAAGPLDRDREAR